jgi:ABC-2 type transport system ATP-binding protein
VSFAVQTTDLDVRFGSVAALDHVSFETATGTIAGLFGRNGAGKTTLMRVLSARLRPSGGRVLVDGEDPYENPRVMADVCLVREGGDFDDSSRIADELELCELLRPRWDAAYAARLLERFELSPRQKVGALSTGKRSALSIVVGLATRAELTMFDEPHLGLDAPSRTAFYDELLADYIAHPRTIIISSHLIDEVAPLVEQVIIIDEGRLVVHAPAEALRARGAEITGPAAVVDDFTRDLEVLSTRELGPTRSAVVFTELDSAARHAAAERGLEVGPIPLQDLFISLTAKERVP